MSGNSNNIDNDNNSHTCIDTYIGTNLDAENSFSTNTNTASIIECSNSTNSDISITIQKTQIQVLLQWH